MKRPSRHLSIRRKTTIKGIELAAKLRATTMHWAAQGDLRSHRVFLTLLVFLLSLHLAAQDTPIGPPGLEVATEETPAAAASTDALRKATQNPVASLISVPIQNNGNFGVGPDNRTQDVLNIQPVIPVRLSANWNVITRIITPIIFQPTLSQPVNQGAYGFGDLNPSFFFSPAKASKLIWGAGPTVVLPTATNSILGQGKWSAGPTVVALSQPGKWTIGALANNVWSFAGQSRRPDVNQMLINWFVNYNLDKGWYVGTLPIVTANWNAPSGRGWVVPLGASVGRIMKVGFQPVNIQIGFYGNAVHPPGASSWNMRAQIAFLFPKLTPAMKKAILQQNLKQLEQQQQATPPQK